MAGPRRQTRRPLPPGARKDWSQLSDKYRRQLSTQLRQAALETLSTLQDIGPAWSGQFQASWEVEAQGRSIPSASGVPTLVAAKQGPDLRRLGYKIGNSAPHADQAMDIVPGGWETQESEPLKPRLNELPARRVGAGRTDVMPAEGAGSTAGFTAEADWWRTYAQAGQFSDDVQKGFRLGSRQARAVNQG